MAASRIAPRHRMVVVVSCVLCLCYGVSRMSMCPMSCVLCLCVPCPLCRTNGLQHLTQRSSSYMALLQQGGSPIFMALLPQGGSRRRRYRSGRPGGQEPEKEQPKKEDHHRRLFCCVGGDFGVVRFIGRAIGGPGQADEGGGDGGGGGRQSEDGETLRGARRPRGVNVTVVIRDSPRIAIE